MAESMRMMLLSALEVLWNDPTEERPASYEQTPMVDCLQQAMWQTRSRIRYLKSNLWVRLENGRQNAFAEFVTRVTTSVLCIGTIADSHIIDACKLTNFYSFQVFVITT